MKIRRKRAFAETLELRAIAQGLARRRSGLRGAGPPALGLPGARCSAAQRFAPGINAAGRCAKTKECEGGLIQRGVMAAPSRSPWSWPRPSSASNMKGKDWAKLDRQAPGGRTCGDRLRAGFVAAGRRPFLGTDAGVAAASKKDVFVETVGRKRQEKFDGDAALEAAHDLAGRAAERDAGADRQRLVDRNRGA